MVPILSRHTPLRTDDEIEAAYTQGLLRKESLVDGAYYHGNCRNTDVARWNSKCGVFLYMRTKFGSRFVESIKHPWDDRVYDVFICVEATVPSELNAVSDDVFARWTSRS